MSLLIIRKSGSGLGNMVRVDERDGAEADFAAGRDRTWAFSWRERCGYLVLVMGD